ncbi:hypothetical protein LEP1GSC133_1180 [Leptospira borgpetersenii serovar Pomona str. 200901868]|uniref:Uncharacterized protein n=1 Tax=Leptospira borgpetersenii serovar Pomona str. 200901868 TaxID=1192866 RepID=M6WPW3_LEPBO|nr:hypothetical protein LEP1GSC133_1180 [Leptospira borgpetersenii serovar Pomona str. 200901868]
MIKTILLRFKPNINNFRFSLSKYKKMEQNNRKMYNIDTVIGKNKDTRDTNVFVTDKPIKTLSVN